MDIFIFFCLANERNENIKPEWHGILMLWNICMRKVFGGLKIKDYSSGCFYKYMAGQAPTSQNLCSEWDLNIVDSEHLDCSPIAVEIVPFFLIDVTVFFIV